MGAKQKTNWWIDLILFMGFITTFFLDITGISLHQWIGIFSVLLAGYHLFLHRNWLLTVGKRFFAKLSGKSRVYYLLDTFLLAGFAFIGLTGLFISTWRNLPLQKYNTWLDAHITITIISLSLLFLKLAFHVRWIVQIGRKIFSTPIAAPVRAGMMPHVATQQKRIQRREFLAVIGVISEASLFALMNGSKQLASSLF